MSHLRRFGDRPGIPWRSLRRLLAAGCLALWLLPAAAQETEDDFAALNLALDRLDSRLERVREAIDLTRLDADELVFDQAFDGDALVAFVNREIAFHPYEGLLRGIRGTLHARAGNSLDQSLLLAYLLKTAGLDARVVRGRLTGDQAQALLTKSRAAGPSAGLAQAEAAIREQFGEAALEGASAAEFDQAELWRQAEAEANRLLAQLQGAGLSPDGASIESALLEHARDYFWVEHRAGPGQDWSVAHPAFGGDPGFDPEPVEYMAERIDEKFHHRLTVEAFARQRQAGSMKTHRLMRPFTRPVANLHGVVISYRNHPGGLTADSLLNLEETLGSDEILTPVFRGAPAPGAMAFDLKGRAIDPMALGSDVGGAAGLFARLSDKMEAATGTMADPDDPKAVFALDAMWLEFTWESPSGEKATQRRYLLPPAQGRERTPAELLWPLISEYVYVVNAGEMPLNYIAERYLESGRASLGIFRALSHKMLRPEAGTPLPDDNVPQDFGPLALYRIMAETPGPGGSLRVRHRPALVGLRNGLRDADTAFSAVDVVFNQAHYLSERDGGWTHDPLAAIRQGVWETRVEMVPGLLRSDQVVKRTSVFGVFDAARAQGIAIHVLAPGDRDSLAALSLDATSMELLRHDLDDGFVVVAPERRPDGLAMGGWWRVDPVSGVTLGMTADGHGQDVVEYLIDITGIAFNLVQALGGLMACEKHDEPLVKMCCLVEAHINNVAGLSMGSILGATVGSAGAAVFDIVNFGMQETTGAVFGDENKKGLMPQMDMSCKKLQGRGF